MTDIWIADRGEDDRPNGFYTVRNGNGVVLRRNVPESELHTASCILEPMPEAPEPSDPSAPER